MKYPVTPDERYFVVRGRLWRMANPKLTKTERDALQSQLMRARSRLGWARKSGDDEARVAARDAIDRVKIALGERGTPWWTDGTPDYNRRMAVNTPYRAWFEALNDTAGPGPNAVAMDREVDRRTEKERTP